MMKRLTTTGLQVAFGLNEQLTFAPSEWVFQERWPLILLQGANGSGKTTFLNILSGHVSPTQGLARFDGTPVSGRGQSWAVNRGIARSFQNPLMCTHLTVWENILLATYTRWWERADRLRHAIERRLSEIQMQGCASRSPAELSFGQRRIVDLIRIEFLVKRGSARLVLLDEPLAGLDIEHRREASRLIDSILTLSIPTIVVEHGSVLGSFTSDAQCFELVRNGASTCFEPRLLEKMVRSLR